MITRRGKIVVGVIVAVFSAAMIAWGPDSKAHADSVKITTNCYSGVQAIAATTTVVYYACKDAGDHSIYRVLTQ